MSLALETFVKRITDSGVLAAGKLERFVPPKAHPKDVQELARELVRSKQLTKFQVQQIYQGRARSLILGNYTILDKIGAGGMGQVFKAHHRRMERVVAIKTLPAATLKDPAAVARFQREVVAAAKLRHPNIVAADDADEAGGVHFLVMEYIEGRDLSAVVKEIGPLPVATAVGYVLQAARGLEFAHKKGVVHRDIKPANLLLDNEGTVKVLDMGLARLGAEDEVTTRAELTGTGAVMGTVDYMAPEQAISTKHADARADIYSLGCSLCYLLTGRPTYDGDTLMARLIAHREAPIPSLKGVPPAVRAAFERMVAKRPEDRFPTMTEVVSALEGCLAGVSLAPAGPAAPREAGTDDDLLSFFRGIVTDTEIEPGTKLMPMAARAPAASAVGKRRLLVGVAAGLLGLMVLWGIVVTLRTKDGTLVVEVDQPDAVVKVFDADGKVEITRSGEKGHISIAVVAGTHQLRVEKDGFVVYTSGKIEIGSRDSKTIRAHLDPVAIAKAPARSRETPEFQTWRNGLKALSAADRTRAVEDKLRELNPGYTEKGDWTIADGRVMGFKVTSDHLRDVSPLGALSDLTKVSLMDTGRSGPRQVPDLSGLAGLKLNELVCRATDLSDIEPLRGMPLTTLVLYQSQISDLSPLKGMPLTTLAVGLAGTTTSLEPLRGLALRVLSVEGAVADVSPVLGMPLTTLGLQRSNVTDLSPFAGMPLENLDFAGTPVADMSPVAGIKTLRFLNFTPVNVTRGIAAVRAMPSLERIGTAWNSNWPAKEFWERYDKGEFGKAPTVARTWDTPDFRRWMGEVAAMPAEKQVEAVSKKLMELNPGFDGKLWSPLDETSPPVVKDGNVVGLRIFTDKVADLSPIRALSELGELHCLSRPNEPDTGLRLDLSPLNGMKIRSLKCVVHNLDLSTVKGLPLSHLGCYVSNITDLTPISGMPLQTLQISGSWEIKSLAPLKGMPLTRLSCDNTQVADLSPLSGMPLTVLVCHVTKVADLSPLKGMPLEYLSFHNTPVEDVSPVATIKTLKLLTFTPSTVTRGITALRAMPGLERVGTAEGKNYPAKEFWERHDRGEFGKAPAVARTWDTPDFRRWMGEVAAMPAEKQVEAVSKKLMELNPGFDGKLWSPRPDGKLPSPQDETIPPIVEDGNVVTLLIITDKVVDLSPIRALSELRDFDCVSRQNTLDTGQRLDLSPLNGMKIRKLKTVVYNLDLSTVKGLPLSGLACFGGNITDLTPVTLMPLQTLWLSGNWELKSLEPLKGMRLTFLACDNTQVADLSPLSGMPLTTLFCHVTKVADLSPLKGMPLEGLTIESTPVEDVSVVATIKTLKVLSFTPANVTRGIAAVRAMPSLERVGTAYNKPYPAKEFWERYDRGEFGKAPTEPGQPK